VGELIYLALLRRYNFEKSGDWEMVMNPEVLVPHEAIAALCKPNGIRRLSLFESALNDRTRPESDRLTHDVAPPKPTLG
jgi:hypothetical protein